MPLFGKQPKTVPELVKTARESLALIDGSKKEKKSEKASEDLCRCLLTIRNMLYGSAEQDTSADQTAAVAQELYNTNLLLQLVLDLPKIEFEGRKDFALIFNAVLRRQVGTMLPTVDYCCKNKTILFTLLRGYENAEIALNCGSMLRECIKHESLARILLESDEFYDFFKYVELNSFDFASDAFLTFKELLTRHKALSAQFLEKNYDRFFERYSQLLNSENYVTKRQALKLLGELLLDRFNFSVMTKYISNAENLKLMMNLLRSKQRNIQFEAFHVFKVFVANPNKPQPILDILLRNKDKLVEFLSQFHNDRTDDEQFNDEKTYLIKQIRELRPLNAQ